MASRDILVILELFTMVHGRHRACGSLASVQSMAARTGRELPGLPYYLPMVSSKNFSDFLFQGLQPRPFGCNRSANNPSYGSTSSKSVGRHSKENRRSSSLPESRRSRSWHCIHLQHHIGHWDVGARHTSKTDDSA